jgi:hypothetical protein
MFKCSTIQKKRALPTNRWIQWVLGAVLVLNLLDAMFTLFAVKSGLAAEANPLMDELLTASPLRFMIVKLALVSMGIWVLWQFRERRSAVIGSLGAVSIYGLILVHHIQGLAGTGLLLQL